MSLLIYRDVRGDFGLPLRRHDNVFSELQLFSNFSFLYLILISAGIYAGYNCSFSFWYHMHGVDVATFDVVMKTTAGENYSYFPVYSMIFLPKKGIRNTMSGEIESN